MPLLEARGLTKRFPGVTALSGVDFDVRQGELHALCGENGAGKSTLIKLLSGVHPYGSYEGEFFVDGNPARFSSVADAEAAGLAVIYQELALVPEMTVAENLFLGAEPKKGPFIDWETVRREAKALLEGFGLRIDPLAKTSSLGTGQRQLVEILKALRKRSRVLILDEPTAALTESESATLLERLRELKSRGIGLVYVSHRLEEVFSIADRVTVLRDGTSVGTLEGARIEKREVIRRMVGREISELFPRRAGSPGPVRLRLRDLSVEDEEGAPRLRGISLDVRAGEVVGLGGLMGSGRSELLMHLFGAWGRRSGGTVELDGAEFEPSGPEQALARGLGLVTEDRRRYGLALSRSVGFNMTLSSLPRWSKFGFVDTRKEEAAAGGMFDSLRVKASGLGAEVGRLSGGNQQKVVLGKTLLTEPKVILLDEPTRGVDVGAKVELYELINRLTDEGKAVLLVSSELPELLGMSDRILMLHEGTIGGGFERGEATQERLLAAALGHAP
jgi:D-xylose transport system ATP-binding protein